jgi:AcrR family transcriptional regulator
VLSEPVPPRRRYDSQLRRERAAQTRARIVSAGADLIHGFPIWNWDALTVRAVAQRAGVNERTVYRYFPSERELRDEVLSKLEEEAGVNLENLTLEGLGEMTSRILEYASRFPFEPRVPNDPTVAAANKRQREALIGAVTQSTEGWAHRDRVVAASVLDVLWSVVSYERLVANWDLDPKEAIRAITWVMGLIEDAVRRDHRPLS